MVSFKHSCGGSVTPITPRKRPISLDRAHTCMVLVVCVYKQNIRNLALDDDTIQETFCYDGNVLCLRCPVWTCVAIDHLQCG